MLMLGCKVTHLPLKTVIYANLFVNVSSKLCGKRTMWIAFVWDLIFFRGLNRKKKLRVVITFTDCIVELLNNNAVFFKGFSRLKYFVSVLDEMEVFDLSD